MGKKDQPDFLVPAALRALAVMLALHGREVGPDLRARGRTPRDLRPRGSRPRLAARRRRSAHLGRGHCDRRGLRALPDGLPVTLQGRERIGEAIRSWARGICPQCGGRWTKTHPCGDPAYPPYFADDVAEIICAVIDITTQCLLAKPPGQAQEHMLYLLGIFTAQHADRLRAEARAAGLTLELSPEPS